MTAPSAGSAPPTLPSPGQALYMSPGGVLTNFAFVPRTAWPVAPAISAGTLGDLSVVYTNRVGNYSRIGNRVFIDFLVSFTPTYTTAAMNVLITNLPFVPIAAAALAICPPITSFSWGGGTYTMIVPVVQVGTSNIQFNLFKSGASGGSLAITSLTSGTAVLLSGSGSYDTTNAQ